MIGGIVKETLDCGVKLWVNVKASHCYNKGGCLGEQCKHEECAIYIERNETSLRVIPGDKLWWQGKFAYWTPSQSEESDIPILRLGYSGVNHPAQAMMELAGFVE